MPDTDNEFMLDAIQPEAEPVIQAGEVLMTRDPKAKGGRGVVKMLVPADEVGNYKKAGWFKA